MGGEASRTDIGRGHRNAAISRAHSPLPPRCLLPRRLTAHRACRHVLRNAACLSWSARRCLSRVAWRLHAIRRWVVSRETVTAPSRVTARCRRSHPQLARGLHPARPAAPRARRRGLLVLRSRRCSGHREASACRDELRVRDGSGCGSGSRHGVAPDLNTGSGSANTVTTVSSATRPCTAPSAAWGAAGACGATRRELTRHACPRCTSLAESVVAEWPAVESYRRAACRSHSLTRAREGPLRGGDTA